jgi:hypothetical protein
MELQVPQDLQVPMVSMERQVRQARLELRVRQVRAVQSQLMILMLALLALYIHLVQHLMLEHKARAHRSNCNCAVVLPHNGLVLILFLPQVRSVLKQILTSLNWAMARLHGHHCHMAVCKVLLVHKEAQAVLRVLQVLLEPLVLPDL